jgi:TRAP-type uncharacterized transport system substrate-binding protein
MLLLMVLGAALALPPRGQAAPVMTLLVPPHHPEASRFGQDVARLWRFRDTPSGVRLAVEPMAQAVSRLHAVHRGRAQYAVVDAAEAHALLREFPYLAVVSVLWGEYLHVVTRDPAIQTLGIPLPGPVRMLPSAAYVRIALRNLIGDNLRETDLLQTTGGSLESALAGLERGVLLFSGTVPQALLNAPATDRLPLRLVSLSRELLEELQLAFPWLLRGSLKPQDYPVLRSGIEVPVVHALLIARVDLAADSVTKMLDALYDNPRPLREANPQFEEIDQARLAAIGGSLPLHPLTRARFGITAGLPAPTVPPRIARGAPRR